MKLPRAPPGGASGREGLTPVGGGRNIARIQPATGSRDPGCLVGEIRSELFGTHPEIRRELFGVRAARDQALSLVDRSVYQKGLTAHRCRGGSL